MAVSANDPWVSDAIGKCQQQALDAPEAVVAKLHQELGERLCESALSATELSVLAKCLLSLAPAPNLDPEK